jgi:predicted ATPase
LGLRGYENVDLDSLVLHVLAPQNKLLLFDNFEHLVKEAPFLVEILRAAPGVKILVTSREKLNLRNEHVFPLGGMGYPTQEKGSDIDEHGSGVLFSQTAQRLKPGFTLSPSNRLFVDQICRLVEGMPLAIELAASWVDTLSLQEIAHQIEDSLDILAAEMQDAPQRHQSIRLVFESTYQTLEQVLKETFASLSVFRGSFSSQAAGRIAGASPYELRTLVNKSLLAPLEGGRFQIHELLRQYAKEKLKETPEAEKTAGERHCTYYAEYLAQRDVQTEDGETDEVIQEIENIRAGFRWAVRHEKFPEISQYLPRFSQLLRDLGPRDLISTFSWAVTSLRSGEPSREKEAITGSLLSLVGVEEYLSGEHDQGKEKALEGLIMLRRSGCEDINLADALLMAANLYVYGRDYDYAPILQEGLRIYRESSHHGIEFALVKIGEYMLARGDNESAETYFQEALDASIRGHSRWGIAWSSFNLGRVAEARGSLLAAIDHFRKSAALFKEIHNKQLYAVANKYLGNTNYFLRQYPAAIHYYREFLEVSRETGIQWRLAEAITYLGKTMREMGKIDRAEKYLLKARQICEEADPNVMLGFLLPDLGLLAFHRGDLQGAVEYYLSALNNQWSDQSKFVRHYAMVQAIPLLEKAGHTSLAGSIAASILADPAYHQITTRQPAKEYLEKIRAALPEDEYQAILDHGKGVDMETLLSDLNEILQNPQVLMDTGKSIPRS